MGRVVGLVAGGLAAVAGAVALLVFAATSDPAGTVPGAEARGDSSAADRAARDDAPVAAASTEPPAAPATPPELDLVRIDADGRGVVAGRVPPGTATVAVRIDDVTVAEAVVDGAGAFAAVFDAGASARPRLLTVAPVGPAGTAAEGDVASILIAPRAVVTDLGAAPEGLPAAAAPDPIGAADGGAARVPGGGMVEEAKAATGEAATAVAQDDAAPLLLRLDGEAIAPVRPAPLGGEAGLSLDAISYGEAGDVKLAGTAPAEGEVRVFLDGERIGPPVDVDPRGAWASPLPDVDAGVYDLRIEQVGPDGAVLASVETPFERSAPEAVAAAARRDGAAAVTVQAGWTLWAISEGYYGDGVGYVQIFEANRDVIRNPDLIYPGQVIALPVDEG